MRGLLTLIFLPFLIVASLGNEPRETNLAREQRLRQALAAAEPQSEAHRDAAIELASVLTFSLERDFAEALALAEPWLRAAERAEPPDAEQLDRLRHIVGFALSYLGRNDDAEKLLVALRDAQIARLGAEAEATLETRADLGIFYGRIGRPDLSEPELREVARIFVARDPSADTALHAQTNWSIALGRLGRWADAERVLREVIARRTQLLGPDHPHLAHQFGLLCWVLFATDRAAEAVPLMEQIVRTRTQEFGDDATTTQTARFNLASLYSRVGRDDEAEQLWRTDLAKVLEHPGGRHEPAGYLRKLGELALRRGQLDTAVEDLTRAEALLQRAHSGGWRDADSRDLEQVRLLLARAQLTAGNRSAATSVAKDWLALIEQQFALRLLFTSESDRVAFHRHEQPFDLPGTLGDPELMARATLRLKGLVLDSLIEDQALANATGDPEITELLARYRVALSSSETLAAASPLELSAVERLEREIVRRTRGVTLPRAALRAEPAAVLAALPSNTACVDYVRYEHFLDGATTERRYLALIGTRSGWRIVPLGAAGAIDEAVARYRVLAERGGPIAWARELRRLALDPVRAQLPTDVTRLMISPDSELHGVALGSLPEDDGANAFDRHAYAQITSLRDLLLRANEVSPPATAPLVLASPTWSGPLASLAPLPASFDEARELGIRFPDARILTGDEATSGALARAASPWLLHFATHAEAGDEQASEASTAMRRAGLALAGPDGWCDALQIAALDLRGTELVFLSACATGGGPALVGEGVLGLPRGFLRAGAHAIVSTLWPIDDIASGELTRAFYERFERGVDAVETLRRAQQTVRDRWRSEGVEATERLRRLGAHTITVRR